MYSHRFQILAALSFALAACTRAPVQISPQTVADRSRWHASLASPSELAGAVQITGTASFGPGSKNGTTDVALHVENAVPGGMHPWAVHKGNCGSNDQGIFGNPDAYAPVKVGASGKADATVTIPVEAPTSGDYFVIVYAAPTNMNMTIACGNFAPPTP